jgi:hypothetical protein
MTSMNETIADLRDNSSKENEVFLAKKEQSVTV